MLLRCTGRNSCPFRADVENEIADVPLFMSVSVRSDTGNLQTDAKRVANRISGTTKS